MTAEEFVKMWTEESNAANDCEEWRDVVGYENLYQVSNFGNVKSKKKIVRSKNRWGGCTITYPEKQLKPAKTKNGYMLIQLYKHGKKKVYSVHRLVAQAFIENKDKMPCVNHINSIRHDNRVCNLEWCNHSYNVKYAYTNNNYINPRRKRVRCLETNEVFDSIRAAQIKYKEAHISDVLRGKLKTTNGYHWEVV